MTMLTILYSPGWQFMTKHIGLAEAKATLSAVVNGVLHGRERYVIERHGKGVAALVSLDELARIESNMPDGDRPAGALALVGVWEDVADADIDTFLVDIQRARTNDAGRRVEIQP